MIYPGHLNVSGKQWTIREHGEEKALRKTFHLLIMCKETNLGWQCCVDSTVVPCWSSGVGFPIVRGGGV